MCVCVCACACACVLQFIRVYLSTDWFLLIYTKDVEGEEGKTVWHTYSYRKNKNKKNCNAFTVGNLVNWILKVTYSYTRPTSLYIIKSYHHSSLTSICQKIKIPYRLYKNIHVLGHIHSYQVSRMLRGSHAILPYQSATHGSTTFLLLPRNHRNGR